MSPSDVTTANLAAYDTAVLNMGSSAMACDTNNLSDSAKADLIAFVADGKKLIIFDSECYPGPVDYSWMPFPFTTANPGALGAQGILTVVEENTLSSNDLSSPYYIDAAHLGSNTDAVGDMNVMTTYDANWCIDMSGTNAINITGPVHTYAKYPAGTDTGLIIYNGLDQDYQYAFSNDPWLREIWVLELQQSFNPSNLPCGYTVVGITLTQTSAVNEINTPHTVTANLTDLLGTPQPGVPVSFSVVSGPNAGATGVCSPNADCTTDSNGQVSFTYDGGPTEGQDKIQACFTDTAGNEICSQEATKDWVLPPNYCQYCCKIVITGITFSCGGFYIPGAYIDLYGPLRDDAVEGMASTESNTMGQYGLWVKVPLGNHWGNTVVAFAWFEWGGPNEVYYEGVTAGFNVDCAVIGQYVMLTKDIPMWAY
jgi:hypothetical protein